MKFTCNQQIMTKALNTVSKAVSNRTTMPILKGILIEAVNGKIRMTASDLDISIKKEIEADVNEEGSVVVVAKLFGDIMRKLPNEDILIESQEDNSIFIKSSSSEFRVICLPYDEFPNVGEINKDLSPMSFDSQLFTEMVRKTAFAASIDESKGVLTGIKTEITENSVKMVAIDGFRLALVNEVMKAPEERSFIISARTMNEISKIVSDEAFEEDIKIYIDDKRAAFVVGSTEILLRLMEGEFIKYKDLIPSESATRIIVSKALILEGIERASLFAKEGKNNLIKMSVKEGMVTITSRSEEGNVREEIPVDQFGNDLDIGFNSKYVIDVIKAIGDESFSMNFKTGISPCVVRPAEGNDYEYLILPVRIPVM